MSLTKEISDRANEIDRASSEKDRIFYNFLTGKKIDLPENNSQLDVLKVCYSAFTKSLNEKELVETLQRTKPIKGLHYTNNLVELIAMTLHDFEGEKDNLQKYVDSHNVKDAYIVGKIFPQIKPENIAKVETAIDHLVDDILIKRDVADGEEKILNALKNVNDLLDIFVIEEATETVYEKHPSSLDKRNIQYLLAFYIRLHRLLRFIFSLLFYAILLGAMLYVTYLLTQYFVNNWTILEPYLAVIQIVGPFILAVILGGLGKKLKVLDLIKPGVDKVVYLIESALFKVLGINLSKILEIESEINKAADNK